MRANILSLDITCPLIAVTPQECVAEANCEMVCRLPTDSNGNMCNVHTENNSKYPYNGMEPYNGKIYKCAKLQS